MKSTSVPMVLSLLLLTACSEDDSPGLEDDDAREIPAGDAETSDFAGRYTVTSYETNRCVCAEGEGVFDCSSISLAAAELDVGQMGGALSLQPVVGGSPDPRFMLRGGVDEDGAFTVGGVVDVFGESGKAVGTARTLVEGSFEARELVGLWTDRIRARIGGEDVDCELSSEVTAVRR